MKSNTKELYAVRSPGFQNKEVLKDTALCGCYYCLKKYPFENIKEWVDTNQTAICPECSIDSVVPLELNSPEKHKELLESLYHKYFSRSFL